MRYLTALGPIFIAAALLRPSPEPINLNPRMLSGYNSPIRAQLVQIWQNLTPKAKREASLFEGSVSFGTGKTCYYKPVLAWAKNDQFFIQLTTTNELEEKIPCPILSKHDPSPLTLDISEIDSSFRKTGSPLKLATIINHYIER